MNFEIPLLMVHLTGIEPAHLSILDPKSSASASSATGAYIKLIFSRQLIKIGVFANFTIPAFA